MEEVDVFGRRVIYADHELTDKESRLLCHGKAVLYPRQTGATPVDIQVPLPSSGSGEASRHHNENKIGEGIALLWLLPIIGIIIWGFFSDAKENNRPVKEEVREFFREWPSDMKNSFVEIWRALRE